ncbi:MAG: hypothetical protein LUQ13_00980 [Methanomicrobiales archaeon]|nr:hypothetical protein [Methanomicrobiales archaeon]
MAEEEKKDSLEKAAEALGEVIGKSIRRGARLLDAIAKGIEDELAREDEPSGTKKEPPASKPADEPSAPPAEDKPL